MVLANRRSSSAASLSHHKRSASYTRVYSRKKHFIVKHFPKFVFLSSVFWYLFRRRHNLLGQRKASLKPKITKVKFPIASPFNVTLSSGIRRKGVSLVSSCQNHHEALRYTLPSWIKVTGLDEIILIDWSSKPALHFLVEELKDIRSKDPTVYVIEVKDQGKWEPSRALNLGFRAAHYSQVLRVECDQRVKEDFILTHRLSNHSFFAGNTYLERSQVDEHLFGTLFIEKKDFIQAGGYDERIQDHSRESENLFDRLTEGGMKRLDIDYAKLMHNHHDDRSLSVKNVEGYIEGEVDAILLESAPPWSNLVAWKSMSFNISSLSTVNSSVVSRSHSNAYYRSIATFAHVPSIREMSSESDVEKARQGVLSSILLKKFALPIAFSQAIPLSDKFQVLKGLVSKSNHLRNRSPPRVLIIHCIGGLVSRLYALLSGLSFAEQTGRIPFVIWESEEALMNSPLADLLQSENSVAVISVNFTKKSFNQLKVETEAGRTGLSMVFYDLAMNGGQKKQIISNAPGVHIYVRASGALVTDTLRHTSEPSMAQQLKKITVHESIHLELRKLHDRKIQNAIGVYVPYSNRNQSFDIRSFIQTIRGQMQKAPAFWRIYIDSDPSIVESFRSEFLNVLVAPSAPEDCDVEGLQCARNVMLRLLALNNTAKFMCPDDDSFSSLVKLIRGDSSTW